MVTWRFRGTGRRGRRPLRIRLSIEHRVGAAPLGRPGPGNCRFTDKRPAGGTGHGNMEVPGNGPPGPGPDTPGQEMIDSALRFLYNVRMNTGKR